VIDVFEVLVTQIGELNADLASDMIVGGRRDSNATRLCNALQPGRDVNAISKDVMRLDNYVQHGQFGMRSLSVIVHEPRVASHVGGQYRRQPALDPDWPFLHHGPQTCP
jgi:hypothetical protein